MSELAEIVGRDFTITDSIKEYVTKKVAKLERQLNTSDEIRVELSYAKAARSATNRYAAQFTVRGKGMLLRSEERSEDIRGAIDIALEKLLRQTARFKGKRQRGRGDGKTAADVAPVDELEYLEEEDSVVVRRKAFEMIPMDEKEAIEQMKLLGHDNFFVFFNAESGVINVLYKRWDGDYGLIEPLVR